MSRNKFIVIVILFALLYNFLPDTGIYHTIKVNALIILPYFLVCMMLYLFITLHLLKKAWRKLDAQLLDENVVHFSKIMNRSFDVVRMLGESNLIALYQKVNFAKSVSIHSKTLMYEAMKRKRLDVILPNEVNNIAKKVK